MSSSESFHSARRMGGWVIDMTDVELAHAAIALCRSGSPAPLEVRHTLWGVQVRTDSQDAVDLLARRYLEPAPAALAA